MAWIDGWMDRGMEGGPAKLLTVPQFLASKKSQGM